MRYNQDFGKYLVYDETSPSCLRWKEVKRFSKAKVGDIVGSLDKSNNTWVLNSSQKLLIHKVIWAMHFPDDCQDGLVIDHIDGDRKNNMISNLRLVTGEINSQNKRMNILNSTGTNGVVYSEGLTRHGTYYSKYTASIYHKCKKVSSSFSIQKYGDDVALALAVAWRTEKMREYNMTGLTHYTDRHGTLC